MLPRKIRTVDLWGVGAAFTLQVGYSTWAATCMELYVHGCKERVKAHDCPVFAEKTLGYELDQKMSLLWATTGW